MHQTQHSAMGAPQEAGRAAKVELYSSKKIYHSIVELLLQYR